MKLSTAIIAGVALLGAATTASAATITVSEAYDYGVFGGYDQVVYQISTPIALDSLIVSGHDFGAVGPGAYNWLGGDPGENSLPIDANVFISKGAQSATHTFSDVYGDYDSQTGMEQLGTMTLNGGVPEPATWGLMMLGFGGIGAAMRASRKVAVAVAG